MNKTKHYIKRFIDYEILPSNDERLTMLKEVDDGGFGSVLCIKEYIEQNMYYKQKRIVAEVNKFFSCESHNYLKNNPILPNKDVNNMIICVLSEMECKYMFNMHSRYLHLVSTLVQSIIDVLENSMMGVNLTENYEMNKFKTQLNNLWDD